MCAQLVSRAPIWIKNYHVIYAGTKTFAVEESMEPQEMEGIGLVIIDFFDDGTLNAG